MNTEATDPIVEQPSDPSAWTERFVAMLHAQRASIREFLAAKEGQIEHSVAQLEELIVQLASESEQAQTAASELASSQAADEASEEEERDFQRRYEMALDDLRELKEKNAELQQQLSHAKSSVTVFGAANNEVFGGTLDWETIKRHLLASLESDAEAGSGERKAERLRIEDVVRVTNNVITEKNREIDELKRQLKQVAGGKPVGVPANPVEQILDTNAAILAERERLRQLQEQWKDKMRQAEIEVSLERAKLTRQRAEIEERLRMVESEQTQPPPPMSPPKGAKPVQRWRVRLGLSDPE